MTSLIYVGLFLLGILLLIPLLALGKRLAEKRLRRWATEMGAELIKWRGVPCWERSVTDNQDVYRVMLRVNSGEIKTGIVVFGSRWHPFASSKYEIDWDREASPW